MARSSQLLGVLLLLCTAVAGASTANRRVLTTRKHGHHHHQHHHALRRLAQEQDRVAGLTLPGTSEALAGAALCKSLVTARAVEGVRLQFYFDFTFSTVITVLLNTHNDQLHNYLQRAPAVLLGLRDGSARLSCVSLRLVQHRGIIVMQAGSAVGPLPP